MLPKLRSRLTYANVVSTICLFILLGGSAYAAATITGAEVVDDSLTGADIKGKSQTSSQPAGNGSIRTEDVYGQPAIPSLGQPFINGSLTGSDVADGSLKGDDIGNSALTGDDIGNGSLSGADVADNTLTGADIATGAVRTDELANGQVQAEDLAPGVAPGASGARAWGQVNEGGLVRSKNVSGVTGGGGVYCIDPGPGIDPTTAVMLVGEDLSNSSTSDSDDDVSHVEWDSIPSDCQAGTMEVQTFYGDGDKPTSSGTGGFVLTASDQGFTFVIP